uniref:Uncharacterized protein LOC104218763 n=1 Tax=Nicotiana sylvestris TaxID=4096 RepID=A0A1U7VZ26_NICSY|nr:PREDICTED: uncharacterized protein LOC104218763 [Nicotiana sylvestris]
MNMLRVNSVDPIGSEEFISKRDFYLVESGEYVSFPWGKIVFRALMKSVWFYECCTVVDQKFVVRVGDHTPRILNWEMTDRPTHEDFSIGFFNSTGNKKYLTSRNRGKHPIDDSDDFVTPPSKHIKEPVLPKKAPKDAPSVQPIDYDRELQKLKADVKQLHKQLNSFMKYVFDKFKDLFELINSKLGASEVKYGAHPEEDISGRQDNNNFVSNMEFGGNEDVEMDGCQVGGSEGKDVPLSQRDTSVED